MQAYYQIQRYAEDGFLKDLRNHSNHGDFQ